MFLAGLTAVDASRMYRCRSISTTLAGAGALRSTVNDALTFLRANMVC
jgi:hypothetical protein